MLKYEILGKYQPRSRALSLSLVERQGRQREKAWERDWESIESFRMKSGQPYLCTRKIKRRPCWCPNPMGFSYKHFLCFNRFVWLLAM